MDLQIHFFCVPRVCGVCVGGGGEGEAGEAGGGVSLEPAGSLAPPNILDLGPSSIQNDTHYNTY